jgi:hypothetical protein
MSYSRAVVNLFRFTYTEDFGGTWYFQLLNFNKHCPAFMKRRSLLQWSFSWNDYPSWPYIQLTFGSSGVMGILFWVYKFGFDLDFLTYTWKMESLPGTSR